MTTKRVLQRNCDRCARVWYEDEDAASKENSVTVTGVFDGTSVDIEFDQLCAGCASTVRGAVESMGKIMAKSSPIRGARKRAKKAEGTGETPAPSPIDAPAATPASPALFVAPAAVRA